MAFDTPMFDTEIRNTLVAAVNDNRLTARYERAVSFLEYLDEVWKTCSARPYFDWTVSRASGQLSFARVKKNLTDMGFIPY
jgi:hypothetical protein